MTPELWLAWLPVATRITALVLVAYEVVIDKLERPTVLMLLGAMLGVGEVTAAWKQTRLNGNGNGSGKSDT